jgi:hypothetical protein
VSAPYLSESLYLLISDQGKESYQLHKEFILYMYKIGELVVLIHLNPRLPRVTEDGHTSNTNSRNRARANPKELSVGKVAKTADR